MKSSRFHSLKTNLFPLNRRILFPGLFERVLRRITGMALLILVLGCSKKDEEVKPVIDDKDPPPVTSITKTIGNTGGAIELDSFAIFIPSGAFSEDVSLELSVVKDPVPYPQPAVTSLYKLKGLPVQFDKPIRLSLKYKGTLQDDYYIAHGYEETLPFTDTTFFSYHLLDCLDSAGYLTGEILPREENSSSGGRKANTSGNNDFQDVIDTFNGVDSNIPYHSVPAGFIINYPKTLDRSVIEQLASVFEEIHEIYRQLGINQNNFPDFNFIKKVIIQDLRKNNTQSKRSLNYNWNNKEYTIGINSLDNNIDQLRNIVGMCFLTRFLDDYVYAETELDIRNPAFWNPVDLSILMWMQEIYSDPAYYDEIILEWINSSKSIINLAIFFNDNNNDQYNFEVIKFLSLIEDPKEFLKRYFLAMKNGSECLPALIRSVDKSVHVWLPDYFRYLFEGKIYDIPGQIFEDKVFKNAEVTFRKNLPLANQTSSYSEEWMDLSAQVFYFYTDNPDITEKSRLTFSISSNDVDSEKLQGLLFKIDKNTKEISFIEKGINLSVSDPLKLKQEMADLFIIVVNSQSLNIDKNRGDNLSTIHMDVKLEQILPYHHLKIRLDSIKVVYKYNNGTNYTSQRVNSSFGYVILYNEYKGSFSKDNKFTGGWDYFYQQENPPVQHHRGQVTATLDPESLLLTDFKIEINTQVLDESGQYDYLFEHAYSITGTNVLLHRYYDGLTGRREGKDIYDHDIVFKETIKYGDPEKNHIHGRTVESFEITDESALKIFFLD